MKTMRQHIPFVIAALMATMLPLGGASSADAPRPAYRSPGEIIAAAPAAHWRRPDPDNLLIMELATGHVVIELAPRFAPEHVANIRTLARERFWDGTTVYRVQDNFVAQFGDVDGDDEAKARPLGTAKRKLPAEFHRPAEGLPFDRLPDVDGWAPEVGFSEGFPAARNPRTGTAWLAHCYGMVGAGRSNADDSSIGAELYVVIGQSPRQLDDNITVVGRVLMGIEHLSALRRGPAPMGFFEQPGDRTPIRSIRLASTLPGASSIPIEVMRTDSQSFRDSVEARRNRIDDFYRRPAGHIDLCNVPVPVRTSGD